MGIFLAIPSRGLVVPGVIEALFNHGADIYAFKILPQSLLCLGFNALWCEALNNRPQVDEFAMLHDDVSPVEPGWLQTLSARRKELGADILSCVIPIKDDRGLSSTAFMDPKTGIMTRLTMREAFTIPETFDAETAGYPGQVILPNTGCWVCDFTKPWVEEFCFSIADRIVREDKDGKPFFKPQALGEDWGLGVWAAKRGLKVMATRMKLFHEGPFRYPVAPWGAWEKDQEVGYAFRPLRQLDEALQMVKGGSVSEQNAGLETNDYLNELQSLQRQIEDAENTKQQCLGAQKMIRHLLQKLQEKKTQAEQAAAQAAAQAEELKTDRNLPVSNGQPVEN